MLLFSETMSEPDRSFMEAFYTQYRVLLYSIALRYTEQKETAEDLVQDALIQLMRHVDTLQTLSENARVHVWRMHPEERRVQLAAPE